MDTAPYKIRKLRRLDENFIISSFLKTIKRAPGIKLMSPSHFNQYYLPVIKSLIRNATILVSCAPENLDLIYSFSITEKELPIVHYTYTKEIYRDLGMMRALLTKAEVNIDTSFLYTIITETNKPLRKRFPKAVYAPQYLLPYLPTRK